jgi:hypothetical protein
MIRKCAWCKREISRDDIEPKLAVSHGICQTCVQKQEAAIEDANDEARLFPSTEVDDSEE